MRNKKPNIFFICCCDNRIIPYKIISKTPGDLFVLRNIGNIVPPYESSEASVATAIEYAIEYLAIPEIIVCGHSDCGAIKAILSEDKNSTLRNWTKYAISPSEDNVTHQINNLMTYPVIKKALENSSLTIHGLWIDPETGESKKIVV